MYKMILCLFPIFLLPITFAEDVKYPKVILAKTLDLIHITNKNFKKTFKVLILEDFHDPLNQKILMTSPHI